MHGASTNFARKLLRWYRANRRDLPWRRSRDPYRVLVSELMLQQTQVATVIPYFERFMERFPAIQILADAPEQEVLRNWQGLGYYSRARNLQRSARAIVERHGGEVPKTVESLQKLPGIGRYTAGAVASIAHDVRAPIVDGNVARVICRLDCIETDPRAPETVALLWRRAEAMLPKRNAGDFNSALMELGATVCVPRSPKCLACPVRTHCRAFDAGVQNQIPRPRRVRTAPMHRRDVFCIRRLGDGVERWLIEQRPAKGRWASMWQFLTLDTAETKKARSIGKLLSVPISTPRKIGSARHALTHRRYTFDVYRCDFDEPSGTELSDAAACAARPRVWVTAADLDRYPFPRPHLKVIKMLDLK